MQFFGTDGIRGEADWLQANEIPKLLGRALASLGHARTRTHGNENAGDENCDAQQDSKLRPIRIAVARDVRLSSPQIERQLLHGLLEHDAEVFCLGVLPTPALVSVSKTLNVDFSVMVTASHNAPSYNGLKVFDHNGEKLSPEEEQNLDNALPTAPKGNALGVVHTVLDAEKIYIDYILKTLNTSFNGVIVHLDCANGCTAELASKVFTLLGATVIAENNIRNGAIVNVGTGSTNMDYLFSKLREGEIGFAFDGDGDRVQGAIFEQNQTVKLLDGDYFLLSLAMLLQKENLLGIPSIVATELSNGKLSLELAQRGISLERTDVGDKFVLDRLKQKNLILGGERSGHIIARCYSPTGDGILSALLLLKARKFGICPAFVPFKQYELNVKVKDRDVALKNPIFLSELKKLKELLDNDGRILVRKSGTEPLIRLMCESDKIEIGDFLTKIGNVLQNN
ncbi:MAG: hypothetical protein PHE93_02560 [Clostridia bacterium]|nr:hypothetical protein [Clostridia bacterium]